MTNKNINSCTKATTCAPSSNSFSLDESQLSLLFPYHIVVDRNLHILHAGESLAELICTTLNSTTNNNTDNDIIGVEYFDTIGINITNSVKTNPSGDILTWDMLEKYAKDKQRLEIDYCGINLKGPIIISHSSGSDDGDDTYAAMLFQSQGVIATSIATLTTNSKQALDTPSKHHLIILPHTLPYTNYILIRTYIYITYVYYRYAYQY